jgi:putative oxidoreductase
VSLVRFVGRACLASMFIHGGYRAFRSPGPRTDKAAALGLPEPELAVRANGLTMTAAGSALALGVKPQMSAAVLAATLIPTTLAGHPFWEESSTEGRRAQTIQFLKNLSMFGGLLVVASME